jgi:hypothetical protein
MTYQTLQTSTWTISLPLDWSQGKVADNGSLYFQAGDGTKGIYITTWNLGAEDTRDAEDIVEAFQVADLNSLKQMVDYHWQLVSQQRNDVNRTSVAITDLLAAEKCYRTVGKILVTLPVAVRASFHDYACADYQVSRDYFVHIIDSFQLHMQ